MQTNKSNYRLEPDMLDRRNLLLCAALSALTIGAPAWADDLPGLPREKVDLVAPPFVHRARTGHQAAAPRSCEFRMTIEEKEVVIDDEGTKIQAMTFNGSMPGPMMVVHEGDYVELTLVNPDDQHDAAQHRLPCRHRRARRRRADAGQSRRAGRCCAGRRRGPASSSITARRAAR